MRTAFWLFVTLVAAQLVLFHHLYQGTYYFLLFLIVLWRFPSLSISHNVIWLFWIDFWIDTLGQIFDWYGKFTWYDEVTHILGGFCIALFFAAIIKLNGSPNRFLTFAMSVAFAVLVMSTYEVLEYWFEQFSSYQFIWSMYDTVHDLQSNLIGAVIGGWLGSWIRVRTPRKTA